jgi:histidinol-phosphate aminotransferase
MIKSYVPGKGKESVPPGVKVVKLGSNENPLGPSKRVLKAIHGVSKSAVNLYPNSMEKELKTAISEYVGVSEGHIVTGNGSDEVLELSTKVFLNRYEKAVIPYPTFSLYENIVRVYSGEPIFVPLNLNFEYNVERLIEAIDKGTKIVFICSPNNPTGSTISRRDLKELLMEEVVVILDEAYAEFAGESNVELVDQYENLVVLRTFSKAFGLAGLRVGYAIADEKVAEFMNKVRLPFSVNTLAQISALAALRDREHLNESVSLVKSGRDLLFRELSKIQGIKVYPSEGNFLLVNTPRRTDVTDELLARGVIVRDCGGFRGLSREYFRVSIGTPEENELFLKALKEIIR